MQVWIASMRIGMRYNPGNASHCVTVQTRNAKMPYKNRELQVHYCQKA